MIPREFRGAWSACVYNIDWPSNKGLSAATQTAELRAMLDKMAKLRMTALIFQIRPNRASKSLDQWHDGSLFGI
jgi:uncharacterized lipoprotein YddW (UPF0748 family)